jgi:hypothetical protein
MGITHKIEETNLALKFLLNAGIWIFKQNLGCIPEDITRMSEMGNRRRGLHKDGGKYRKASGEQTGLEGVGDSGQQMAMVEGVRGSFHPQIEYRKGVEIGHVSSPPPDTLKFITFLLYSGCHFRISGQ